MDRSYNKGVVVSKGHLSQKPLKKENMIRHPKEGHFSSRIAPNPHFPLSAPIGGPLLVSSIFLGSGKKQGGI